MPIQISVTDYDDVLSSSGEILTMYMVLVKLSSQKSYFVAKRYSEFKALYEAIRDTYPELLPKDYRFPNKSLFSNNAQFTKERRVRGFDELLKLILKNHYVQGQQHRLASAGAAVGYIPQPLPLELNKFLELNSTASEHSGQHPLTTTAAIARDSTVATTAKASRRDSGEPMESEDKTLTPANGQSTSRGSLRRRRLSSGASNGAGVDATDVVPLAGRPFSNFQKGDRQGQGGTSSLVGVPAQAQSDSLGAAQTDAAGGGGNDCSSSSLSTTFDIERKLNQSMKKDFIGILSSSMKVSSVAYLLLVLSNVVDVSSARFSSIIITLGALGCLVTFIRCVYLKIEYRRALV